MLPINQGQSPLLPDINSRHGLSLLFRRIFLCCWGIVLYYVSNVSSNLFQLLYNWPKLPDSKGLFHDVLAVLIHPGLLNIIQLPNWAFGVMAILSWPLFVGCVWATLDLKHDLKEKEEREHILRHLVASTQQLPSLTSIVQAPTTNPQPTDLTNQFPKLMGPPFDIGLLPLRILPTALVRKDDLRWLIDRLHGRKETNIILLYGLPGMGKTTLVSNSVYQLLDEGQFRDGIVVYDCKGKNDANEVLRDVLARFDPYRQTPDVSNLTDTTRRLLLMKDALVVLLNIESSHCVDNVVKQLASTHITILLTAQQRYSQILLSGASRQLKELSLEDALNLFAQPLGGNFSRFPLAKRQAAESIVHLLGYHTLAVKLAGAYAVIHDVETMAHELKQDPQRGLKLPNGEIEDAVAHLIDECIRGVPRNAQRLFAALAGFSTIEFGHQAAVALAEKLKITKGNHMIYTLIKRSLIETYVNEKMPVDSDRVRLRIHPLLHLFATNEFKNWSQKKREDAKRAIANYYADYTMRISRKMPDAVLTADEKNIIGALDWTHEQSENELEMTICVGMQNFWFNRRSPTASIYLPQGMKAAETFASTTQKKEDYLQGANLALTHAQILQHNGEIDEAVRLFEENLNVRRSLKDNRSESTVLICLGQIAHQRGRLVEAKSYYDESMEIVREQLDQQTEGILLSYIGDLVWRQGYLEEAENYCRESLDILTSMKRGRNDTQDIQTRQNLAQVLIHLGEIMKVRGKLEEAKIYYQEALKVAYEVQDHRNEGRILGCLGRLAQARGKYIKAEKHYQEALKIAREVQDRRGEGWILGYMGNLAQARKKLEIAENYYQEALKIAHMVQDRQNEGWILGNMGLLAQATKHPSEAYDYYHQALKITREMEDRVHYAYFALAFCAFLVGQKASTKEGCQIIAEVIQLYSQLGLSEEKKAQRIAKRLHC